MRGLGWLGLAPSASILILSAVRNEHADLQHMVPREVLGLEVVTMKTEGWVLTFKPLQRYEYDF